LKGRVLEFKNKLNYMRKILIGLVLATILATPLAALAVSGPQECCKLRRAITIDAGAFTQGLIVGPTTGTGCIIGGAAVTITEAGATANWGTLCFLNVFNGIIDWMFTVLIILVVFFTTLGAFQMITASGNSEKVSKGKDYILYAAIGLAVAFISRALPGFIKTIAGF